MITLHSLCLARSTVTVTLLIGLVGCVGGGETPSPTSFALTVTASGTGSGTVTGTGIRCGEDCTESYARGSSVTLSATPNAGSTFTGWSGGCNGTTCMVTMDTSKTVTATFEQEAAGAENGFADGVMSGTIQNWIGAAATLELVFDAPVPPNDPDGANFEVLAEALINEAGEFTISLPSAEVMANYLEFSYESGPCTFGQGSVAATPNPLAVSDFVRANVLTSQDEIVGYIGLVVGTPPTLDSAPGTAWTHVFPTYTVSGGTVTASCTYDDGTTTTIDETYAPGWNNALHVREANGSDSYDIGNIPSGAVYYYISADENIAF